LIPVLDSWSKRGGGQCGQGDRPWAWPRGRLQCPGQYHRQAPTELFSECRGELPVPIRPSTPWPCDVTSSTSWLLQRSFSAQRQPHPPDLTPNPSHLSGQSRVRGPRPRQTDTFFGDEEADALCNPLVIHATPPSRPGSGSRDIFNLSQLPGYRTDGTCARVTNNQLVFTNRHLSPRSTR